MHCTLVEESRSEFAPLRGIVQGCGKIARGLRRARLRSFRLIFGLAKNGHVHDLDAAAREFRQLGEPVLHVWHRVVRVEICLGGENLVEDEMARLGAVFLEEIDQVLGGSPRTRSISGRVAARSRSSFPGLARTCATPE